MILQCSEVANTHYGNVNVNMNNNDNDKDSDNNKDSCIATSAKCTGNQDLFSLAYLLSKVTLFSFDRHLCGFAFDF